MPITTIVSRPCGQTANAIKAHILRKIDLSISLGYEETIIQIEGECNGFRPKTISQVRSWLLDQSFDIPVEVYIKVRKRGAFVKL